MNRLRRILTVFLVGLTFFVMQSFGCGTLQAQADETVSSPVGIYYKAVPGEARNVNSTDKLRTIDDNNNTGDTDNIRNDNKLVENARKSLKETADNVRESVSRNVNDTARNVGNSVTTPEGNYYKATPNDGNAGNPLKDAADNVREKLNLDEPLPRSTKEFLRSTEKRVENTVEPVTQTPEGYYQVPPRARS